MAYVFDMVNGKYYRHDVEITKIEYDAGIRNVKEAFGYALKKHNGESVEVPIDLAELVEVQLVALESNIQSEDELPETEQKALAYDILMGVSE